MSSECSTEDTAKEKSIFPPQNERLVRILYKILRTNEVNGAEEQLTQEETETLCRQASSLGYKIQKWFDRETLVLVSTEQQEHFGEYERAALDILVSIGKEPGGLSSEHFSTCAIAKELVQNGWIEKHKGRLQLSKRTVLEKGEILSSKCQIDVCQFCNILNHEGNVQHAQCSKYQLCTHIQ
ncbi:hypothetical protein NECID01_0942 [Nematocida sp. AWRm77]|nr:hypothetical protein NECID01_0942 [Nematocida sp. AWRm77]